MELNEQFYMVVVDLTSMAQTVLKAQREFWPFGAIVNAADELGYVAVDIGEREFTNSEMLDELIIVLRKMVTEDQYKAVGICVDSSFRVEGDNKRTDCVCLWLESQSGESRTFMVPYHKKWFGGCKLESLKDGLSEILDNPGPKIFCFGGGSVSD